jgi:hypothetical protein
LLETVRLLDLIEMLLFDMSMVSDSPKPVLVGTRALQTWFEMLPDSVGFRRSDQEVAILSEYAQTFFLPDVSLAHLALDCSDAA